MRSIRVMSKELAEKIAAGEVVERPGSIVKELCENSIDAGSTAVTVETRQGGITYIRVTDNGSGIKADEVGLAFMRHSTSKPITSRNSSMCTRWAFAEKHWQALRLFLI
ncbi:MAG: ATP-binding protein [Oscillospiraceae bacterium]|nr:MAG: ATP-binding protein [Oscillospiraceae bacterium]